MPDSTVPAPAFTTPPAYFADALVDSELLLKYAAESGIVIDDVTRIRTHPLVPASVAIYGYIYHIHHGNLEPVLEANRIGAPRTESGS